MSNEATTTDRGAPVRQLDRAVIRFAGDSGDGMQLTGSQFATTTATVGNDLATLPDFPAEIRAPAGTLAGVSGFQIQFASETVYTPGDAPDVLIAMNAAALHANLKDLPANGMIIVNIDAFKEVDLKKADYTSNPLEDGSLDGYRVIQVELTRLTRAALDDVDLPTQSVDRCKNFFALGMTFYLFGRPLNVSLDWIAKKFAGKPTLIEANQKALRAGQAYCEVTEVFAEKYEVPPAKLEPGTYRNISGNQALALGLVAASKVSGRPIMQGSYPITPASDILHFLASYKNFGVITFQAEDEIAAVGAAIGASFAGSLGITSTSGPGMALKSEFLSLAIMAELPLVMINIQRAGPSTGLPTKTEQSDLAQAISGRFGESPCIVLAASTPADCFEMAYEACRLSLTHMTPVILLSDGFIANGTEPWRLPDLDALPEIPITFHSDPDQFEPYGRDPKTLSRPWAIPGTPGMEHRIGGLEKDESGNVSYDTDNHEKMVLLRAEKVARVADDLPDAVVDDHGDNNGLLVVGWGSTCGAITSAVQRSRNAGRKVSHLHLRHLNPMQKNVKEILERYDKILVPEINCGQLADLLRARFEVSVIPFNHIRGLPFKAQDLETRIAELTDGKP